MGKKDKIGLIIPTRYGSERLYGKVLCPINGKLQIERIIERALESEFLDCIVLAITDDNDQSKKIVDWYFKTNLNDKVKIFLGSHDNIIKRCLNSAYHYGIDVIVDISHDCSFFDPILCDLLIQRLYNYNADYSTNIITRSFPDGFDIQVYTRKIYQKIFDTGLYNPMWSGWNIFYIREKLYPKPRLINLEAETNSFFPDWHLCLDTENDKKLIEKIFYHFENETCLFPYYENIINYLSKNKHLLDLNKNEIPTELEKELI